MNKILVTGADGFIGSHLVEELVRRDFKVKAFVLYNSLGNWGWLDHIDEEIKHNIEIFIGDIRDPESVYNSLKDCNSVLHLAALIGIPYSYVSPYSYIDTNIKGTLNLLKFAKDLNISKFVHTSTSEVYGSAKFVPITEDHPLQGQSPYSASKIGADQLAFSFYNSFDLPISIIRPFNTYGPRQSARAIIPTVITQINNKQKIIKLGSLHPTRDFSYVEDTVSGFIEALTNPSSIGEFINLGSSFEISIGDTVRLIAELLDADIDILTDNERLRPKNSEVSRLFACTKKASKLLKWNPKYSGLDGFKKGLKKTINWFSDDKNLKFYKPEIYNK
tara:strand:+ start:19185 stop:20183 length:999 start_codon:yes stop_codon:yes gene_type:complete